MKEITFDELIHEYTVKMDGITTYYLQPKTVIKLLQQVRDATAKECSAMANEHGAFYTCDEIDFKIVNTEYIIIEQ